MTDQAKSMFQSRARKKWSLLVVKTVSYVLVGIIFSWLVAVLDCLLLPRSSPYAGPIVKGLSADALIWTTTGEPVLATFVAAIDKRDINTGKVRDLGVFGRWLSEQYESAGNRPFALMKTSLKGVDQSGMQLLAATRAIDGPSALSRVAPSGFPQATSIEVYPFVLSRFGWPFPCWDAWLAGNDRNYAGIRLGSFEMPIAIVSWPTRRSPTTPILLSSVFDTWSDYSAREMTALLESSGIEWRKPGEPWTWRDIDQIEWNRIDWQGVRWQLGIETTKSPRIAPIVPVLERLWLSAAFWGLVIFFLKSAVVLWLRRRRLARGLCQRCRYTLPPDLEYCRCPECCEPNVFRNRLDQTRRVPPATGASVTSSTSP